MDTINLEYKEDYAILTMDRGKVNAINHQMVRDLRQALNEIDKESKIRGLIITGKPHYFSAGLDLIELYQYDLDQIREFWKDFMGMMIDLIKFEKPIIAAISGHSPAGGAVIAIGCDYRIMARGDKYHIGLNEVAVGITITEGIFYSYSFWLGKHAAYEAILSGKLFTVAEALEAGLIDEACYLEDLVSAAEDKLTQILSAQDFVLRDAKQVMRRAWIEAVDVDMTAEIEQRSVYWMHPDSRKAIGDFIAKLTGKKK